MISEKTNEDFNKKIDNELKKKELEKKFGAQFGQNHPLPPEVEKEWLNSIEAFEEEFNSAERTTVWDYMGKPSFKKLHEMQPAEVAVELQRLYDMLANNNISLDTLCEVADEELYRFITEELFMQEMDNMRIPGMMSCFIYEEFHPNAEYDIEEAFDYFFSFTMGKMENVRGQGYDMLYVDTANYKDAEGVALNGSDVVNSINNFLASFDCFEIISNDIKNITIDEDQKNAKVNFFIHYKGLFDKRSEAIDFKGDACFRLKPSEYGGWSIYHIDLPGLVI